MRGTRGRRLGPLARILLRFRCKEESCGRTFNALTKTPMAHLGAKKVENGSLIRRPGDDRGQEPGQDRAQLCGVHPTTAFRWRHRFLRAPAVHKPRSLSGIVEADETFVLAESFKGRWSDLPRPAAQTRRHGQASVGPIRTIFPRSRRPRPEAARPSTRSCLRVDGASSRKSACRRGHTGQPSDRRRRPANRRLRPAEPDPGSTRCFRARKASSRKRPHLHINNVNAYHGRLKQWLNRFNGVATKNLPNYLGWRRALEAWGDKLEPPNWIKGAIGNGPYQQLTL